MTHHLKIEKQYYEDIESRAKRFEIRLNDRGYKVDDVIILKEIDADGNFTRRIHTAAITYTSEYKQLKGYIVLGFLLWDDPVNKCMRS